MSTQDRGTQDGGTLDGGAPEIRAQQSLAEQTSFPAASTADPTPAAAPPVHRRDAAAQHV
jgi:hypothetical protein